MNPNELFGHVSPETAYVVPDYPYGFRLRCQIRYWIETKRGKGQRVVSQTSNPKVPGLVWNKPKASTYSDLRVLVLDPTNGHVGNAALGSYASEADIRAFAEKYPQTAAANQKALHLLIAHQRAFQHIKFTVATAPADKVYQTPAEQLAIIRKVTLIELHKLQQEGVDKSTGA
jgi:hypothetical protein